MWRRERYRVLVIPCGWQADVSIASRCSHNLVASEQASDGNKRLVRQNCGLHVLIISVTCPDCRAVTAFCHDCCCLCGCLRRFRYELSRHRSSDRTFVISGIVVNRIYCNRCNCDHWNDCSPFNSCNYCNHRDHRSPFNHCNCHCCNACRCSHGCNGCATWSGMRMVAKLTAVVRSTFGRVS